MDEVRLKKITDSIGLMQKNLECSICLDLLQDPVSTKCDHQFCNFCVLALLQSSSKPSARCPLCKGIITKRSLTKNEQLDEIVKAVRSVITAIEEDSGLRCSPPRGPVLFSQPDPKPRQPTPLKKVKGQISSKAKGQRRAGNVRKTKRRAVETVSVYRDDGESSDSDVFELPSVGHTNVSSSFPRLKTSGKKGYHDNDQGNEELEKEAEDLLAALNTAPLTSHGDIISGYNKDLEQQNNEINLLPINSGNPEEKESQALKSPLKTCQVLTPPADSEIFEVPAPRITIPKEGNQDPYEFVPSQRTPRKVKKKVGRKKNQNAKKEFPIRTKGRFAKQSAPKRDHKSASSCSESDHDIGINQSKTGDKPVKRDASAPPQNQRSICADSKTRNAAPTSGHLKNGGKESRGHLTQEARSTTGINEEDALIDNADVVIDNSGDIPDKDGNDQDEATIAERNLTKNPLPITPVVVIKMGVGNIQGSQQSSEGGMMTDSQPVIINRNHGRRVFATTYGKAKNGMDKSPPLDPQERILDWLVSKNAGSDESDDEEEEKKQEETENSEDLVVQETDVNPVSLPIDEDKGGPDAVCKIRSIEAQSELAEESIPEEGQTNKKKLTPKKRDHSEALEGRDGRRRSGRRSKEASQEKSVLDSAAVGKDTAAIKLSPTENVEKEYPLKHRTAKQRMEENLKEQTETARKESEAAAIKSDWELALELAREFGTEPDHLKTEPTEAGGRWSRRRKGKLAIEAVHESKPVRKSRHHAQENQEKGIKEYNETIGIDSFETQNVNRAPVKTTVKERNSIGADKRKASTSDKRKPSSGSQPNIPAKDHNGEVQQTDCLEAAILKIPETPYVLNQPKGKMSLEGELPPNTGLAEVECQEQVLESSRLSKTVHDTKGSSCQSAEYCTPESKSSQPLTSSLRRSKRGSHPGPPNSNSKVGAQVMAASMEKEKKAEVTDEAPKNDTDLGRTRGNTKEQLGADDSEEKLNIEETALASLPLYTEDIPIGDKDCIKKCRGSDTTESIDLELNSDENEEPDNVMEEELEPSLGGSPAKKNICSSSSKIQQKPSLDEEMSIMDCILPSMTSQECPSLGISPGPSGNSSGTDSDLMRIEAGGVSISKKPDEVVTVLSGSGCISKEASQASVTIISQTKTSGSFPPSLDLNSQPSESLLQPLKKSKRKASQGEKQVSTPHAQDGDSVEKISLKTSLGAKQQVEEIHTSSGSSNSRPTRRISRRKRKTFTINASPSVLPSKEIGTPPSREMPVPDSLEQNTASSDIQTKSKATNEVNQIPKGQSVPSCKETHEADDPDSVTNEKKAQSDVVLGDNMEDSSCSMSLRKSSKSTTDRKSIEIPDEKLKSALKENLVERKKSRSLPTSDSQISRKRAANNIDDSSSTSQETLSRSSLKLKRKSRNGSRQSTQSLVHQRDIEESVVQSSPDQISERLPNDELDGKWNKASRIAGGRRSSGGRSKVSTKPQVSASHSSAIPTTPGASEINEQSSNAIIPARPFQMHSKEYLDEGVDISERSQLTPRSSPRVLRRSARKSRDMTQPRNIADEEEGLQQRTITLPQECITVVDESIGVSLDEKEESQESNKSLHSVEDIFNYHEESRDMFDEEETANDQETMGNEVSQSLNVEIVLLSEDLEAKDGCSQSIVHHDTKSRAGYTSQAKPEVQRESPGVTKKSRHLNMLHETDGTKDAMISQGSCQYDDTEALIPPTPPCHDLSKSRTSSFVHTSGLSKAVAKRKKAQREMEPDMSSLLCPNEEIITREQDSVQAKSLVVETPTVVSRKRKKVSQPQTKDKSIADTPVKAKRGSMGRKGKEVTSDQNALILQDEDQEDACKHFELSPMEPSGGDLRLEEPPNKKSRRVTSQIIEDTPLEFPVKSSNESDEITRRNVRRKKQVITDDVSDDNDDDDDDDDKDDEKEIIGRQRRKKAQRMVQVARDEEDESDDELIPCSFLQTSVKKPMEQEEDDEENPMVTFGDQANSHLGHEVDGGSVSSEDSCASHHMNLTSASSILSSQSEIMNTQQQEKTREDMQALEEQMAELQAALARERGSRSHDDDTNDEDEEEEEEEENPKGLLVEETEGACTPDSKQNNSASPLSRSRGSTKRGSKAGEISDEENEMDEQEEVEPRSPSPPPPLSPSTVRKASSSLSMTDSIRSVTSMVEQYRKSSSKKVTTEKRRIVDDPKVDSDDDVGSSDDVAMVLLKSPRSSRRSSKKRRIERDSLDSDEDEIQDRLNSPPNSRSDSIGKNVEQHEMVHHRRTPPSRTTPTLSDSRASGSRKSPSNTSGMRTPRIPTPRDHQTPRRTPKASSVPSPVDVSMKTQRTSSDVDSPAHSRRRSGDQSLKTPEAGPGPSPRPTSRPMSLIATGLNRVELRQVEQLTSRLANCRFASAFNANTTHVIVKTDSSLVCERTLKYFQGIAARAWIVSFQWIHDSLKAKKLLREEEYEVRGDVVNGLNHHGPKRARTCEGPGFMAKFDLCCIGPFTGLNKDQLVGLCEMCGASTVQHPSLFPYNPGRKAFIVVEPNLDTDRDYQGLQRKFRVPVISREWILDSIAHYKSQPIAEYLLSDLTSSTTDQPIIDLDSDDDDDDQ